MRRKKQDGSNGNKNSCQINFTLADSYHADTPGMEEEKTSALWNVLPRCWSTLNGYHTPREACILVVIGTPCQARELGRCGSVYKKYVI
jgi:hypothetical protein